MAEIKCPKHGVVCTEVIVHRCSKCQEEAAELDPPKVPKGAFGEAITMLYINAQMLDYFCVKSTSDSYRYVARFLEYSRDHQGE